MYIADSSRGFIFISMARLMILSSTSVKLVTKVTPYPLNLR